MVMVLSGMPKFIRCDVFAEVQPIDESHADERLDVPIDGHRIDGRTDLHLQVLDAHGKPLSGEHLKQSDACRSRSEAVLTDEHREFRIGRLVFHDSMILSLAMSATCLRSSLPWSTLF
jgi:hypothetical protein